MATVFKVANGVPCRACGAVRAAASSNDFGLCKNCWGGVVRHCGATVDLRRRAGHKPTEVCEEDVNSWLAHRLRLDVRRLSRDGIVGRCEAISNFVDGNPGTQCAAPAVAFKHGHKICRAHMRQQSLVFATVAPVDEYERLALIIQHLSKADDAFKTMVIRVAAEVSA